MFMNLLQLGMMNRMSIDRGIQNGNIIESILSNNLPATRAPSQFITDIYKTAKGEPSYKSITGLPLVGKLIYEGAFGIGGTTQGKEADLKRIRRNITKGIKEAEDSGKIGSTLRNNVRSFNKDARKFKMAKVKISSLRRLERKRRIEKDKE